MKIRSSFVQSIIVPCVALLALLSGCAGFTEDVAGTACAAETENSIDLQRGSLVDSSSPELPSSDISQTVPDVRVEDKGVAAQFEAAKSMRSGKLVRNAAGDSVTLTFEINGGCVKDGESFAYKSDFYYAETMTFADSFRGDTLLLTRKRAVKDAYDGEQVAFDESMIFVGGTPGVLDGVWRRVPCIYRNTNMYCDDNGYDEFFKFDGDKVEYRTADRFDYNYVETYFVEELFGFMRAQTYTMNLGDVFYRSDLAYAMKESNITVLDKSNRSMKFVYGEKTFDLTVDYISYQDSVAVTLKSGDVTCVGTYREIQDVSDGMCRDENAAYLMEDDSEAYIYVKSNRREFETCVNGILGRESSDW